jgi:hypothetical protein
MKSHVRASARPIARPTRERQDPQICAISAARPLYRCRPKRHLPAQPKGGVTANQSDFPFFDRSKTTATTAHRASAYLCQTQVRGRVMAAVLRSLLNRIPFAATEPPPPFDSARSPHSPTALPARCRPRQAAKPDAPSQSLALWALAPWIPSKSWGRTKVEMRVRRPRPFWRSTHAVPSPWSAAEPSPMELPGGPVARPGAHRTARNPGAQCLASLISAFSQDSEQGADETIELTSLICRAFTSLRAPPGSASAASPSPHRRHPSLNAALISQGGGDARHRLIPWRLPNRSDCVAAVDQSSPSRRGPGQQAAKSPPSRDPAHHDQRTTKRATKAKTR